MDDEKPVLAFDTSAAHCAAALLRDGKIIAAAHVEMGRGQAEHLLPMLEDILAENSLRWADIGRIGVGIGPGNFTGIRISVAAARGLSLGLAVPAIGVSGLEVLAEGEPGTVLAALPAPRNAVYLQLLTDGKPLGAPRLATPDAPPEDLLLPTDTRIVGEAADRLGARLGRPFETRPLTDIAPRIARLAAARVSTNMPRPAPLYVRPADAAPPADPPPVILP
ncbi:TsaB protein, required for threonylcarbamoyladenosine (t(6)A) formation in tRNA [Rhodovulum sp. P5]|uniref:tRNA (adenosine(37)-N6)-threonylcarbamoyltransferase complex dimerization subunit type 1 TsaB n=1 Tax=Rhodovulum sp. P5 TaxID=1564506 RepID=UPI0009C2D35D|nr:tRNA (adenosine(37)-N6)-threonylcarbamoyltransferase complex dimerization subunit type 1 TsaB [Rhodovulum sp. P5]ARE38735.1 TsaB protein, required for threonylcarbamoyladenosine (t(6)A) formation in tRNA [Rhodovulum sp. P5]